MLFLAQQLTQESKLSKAEFAQFRELVNVSDGRALELAVLTEPAELAKRVKALVADSAKPKSILKASHSPARHDLGTAAAAVEGDRKDKERERERERERECERERERPSIRKQLMIFTEKALPPAPGPSSAKDPPLEATETKELPPRPASALEGERRPKNARRLRLYSSTDEEQTPGGSFRPKPLNLSSVKEEKNSGSARKQAEEAEQADALLKIKRMRAFKRRSMPRKLPTQVTEDSYEGFQLKAGVES